MVRPFDNKDSYAYHLSYATLDDYVAYLGVMLFYLPTDFGGQLVWGQAASISATIRQKNASMVTEIT